MCFKRLSHVTSAGIFCVFLFWSFIQYNIICFGLFLFCIYLFIWQPPSCKKQSGFCVRSEFSFLLLILCLFILLSSISSFCIIQAESHLGSCCLNHLFLLHFYAFSISIHWWICWFMQSNWLRQNLFEAELRPDPASWYQRMLF